MRGGFVAEMLGFSGSKIIHEAPPAKRVPILMRDLLNWLEYTDYPPLVSSCVFHYEFEFTPPFIDGNGRMGRLWQTLILGQWCQLFYHLPIESTIKIHQQSYYNALASADNKADSTVFIEFMLDRILNNINDTDQVTDQVKNFFLQ